MSRASRLFALAGTVAIAVACDSATNDAPDGSAPALTLSIPKVNTPRPPPSVPRERTGPVPPAASASPDDHLRALASLLERGEAKELAVDAADPGWGFDHELRRVLMRPHARNVVVELDPPVASGIDRGVAATAWRARLARIRRCYERGLLANPSLAGRVGVRVTIDRSGSVAASENASSDLPDSTVIACIVRLGESLAFPRGTGAGTIVFSTTLAAP